MEDRQLIYDGLPDGVNMSITETIYNVAINESHKGFETCKLYVEVKDPSSVANP